MMECSSLLAMSWVAFLSNDAGWNMESDCTTYGIMYLEVYAIAWHVNDCLSASFEYRSRNSDVIK